MDTHHLLVTKRRGIPELLLLQDIQGQQSSNRAGDMLQRMELNRVLHLPHGEGAAPILQDILLLRPHQPQHNTLDTDNYPIICVTLIQV